ncbi:unnamed protein product [Penicillium salamii]|uniref:Uncharacterized protein n=2 Tax=Penicillium TaxID=5073 RepID=A0A9W4J008_9EURO|nr:unnamed protein product [Penicillium salamii]CRL30641.1 unnamed protein product [Penicillium camemberti]CAG8006300.1 unnamed protein product [Penicillium salamii]CAG8061258.1 unnamed protein product [Penicillium salamii]CAG8093149.1 unnamed protein product [Penicillium salamii]
MPKEATPSRNPMVPPQRAARRSTGARRPPAQPIGTLPGNEGGGREPTSQRPMNIREVPGRTSHVSKTSNQNDSDENFEIVHAHCRKAIEKADAVNRQLTTRYNEQRREVAANAQRFNRERAEMMGNLKKQSDEVQRLNGEVTRLEQLLDTANLNARNLLSRTELQQTLDDIHTAARSFMTHLETKLDENETKIDENGNAQNFSQLPGIDVTGDWLDIEAFDVNNPAETFAEMPGTMFPASNLDGVPNI